MKLMKIKPAELSDSQKSTLQVFLSLAKTNGVLPSRGEMIRAGVSRDKVRHGFISLDQLIDYAKEHCSKELEGILDSRILSDEYKQELQEVIDGCQRFVITTVVGGGKLHQGFYNSIKHYCKVKKAKLLLLRCEDPAAKRRFTIPEELGSDHFILTDTALNDNISISSMKISAKQIIPTTGITRLGKRKGSFIFAAPKIELVFAAIRQHHLPHAVMTTGAITLPTYETTRYMSERTAYLATHDHSVGATIVEIQDDEVFHFRQIQADKQGGFVDLGEYFHGSKVSIMRPKAFVLGDWHSGSTDADAKKAWKEVVMATKPDMLVLHDAFDGASINHHEKNKKIKRAATYKKGALSLENEGQGLAKDLKELLSWVKNVVVVKSNHDLFLDEILEDGRYVNDPINYAACAALVGPAVNGENPLRHLIETHLTDKDLRKRITWLELDDSLLIAGQELGAHGHRGPKGSRGNIKNLSDSLGDGVIGHSHTPGIFRGMTQVGTSGPLDPPYGKGDPNSAFHTSCLVYPNGAKQLINAVKGVWRLK